MSVIKTKDGWVELGANNPLERAYETQGRMGQESIEADVPEINRVRCPLHKPRVMREAALDISVALDSTARKVGIKYGLK